VWQEFWAAFWSPEVQALLAGASGGVVRWLSVKVNWRQGLSMMVVGSLCALYLNPLAVPAIEPVIGVLVLDPASKVGLAGLSGFLIGLGGVSVAAFFIDFWRTWRGHGGGSPPVPPNPGGNNAG
jgi:hypothetical protein